MMHGSLVAQVNDTGKLKAALAYNKGGLPLRTGTVNDFEELFTPKQCSELDSIILKHTGETMNEIVIVTIDRPDVDTSNFEVFVSMLFNHWGTGNKSGNNGVIICIFPKLRRIRIDNGSGIDNILTSEKTKNIIDNIIIPEFKQGNYFEGTKKGLLAIIEQIH